MSDDIHIYHLRDLVDLPKPSWLVDGILHRNTLAAVAATKAAFKTFLALDFGMCIATGKDWNGRKVVQGNVLHLVGEGASGISLRAEAWQEYHDTWLPEPSAWTCTTTSVDLLTKADDLILAIVRAFPTGGLELLVVDTLARNNSGDENSTIQMSALVREVDKVRTLIGCTVLFLHHFNRGGSFRGNTALDGAFDTVVLLDRAGMGDVVTVTCNKQKDADEFDAFRLKRKIVGASMVLEPDDEISAHASLVTRIVGTAGSKGMTRADAERAVELMVPRPFGTTVFGEAWKDAVDAEVIEPKDGLSLMKGTLWVRNLAAIDLGLAA